MQTPGVGFPLVAAVLGAVLYFSPLYLEGMVQNWEPILFVVGLLLIAVEIFVLPGFGIAGIAGIVAVVTGLAFAAIDNDVLRHVFSGELSAGRIVRPFLVVIVGSVAAFVAALYFGRRFLTGDSRLRSRIVLTTDLTPEQGYVGHRLPQDGLVGRTGRSPPFCVRPERSCSTGFITMRSPKTDFLSDGAKKCGSYASGTGNSIANRTFQTLRNPETISPRSPKTDFL